KKWRNFFMAEEKDTEVCEEEEQHESVSEVIEEMEDNKEQEVIDTEENELQAEITNLSKKNETLQNKLLRLQAEFDNYKKRTTKYKIAASKYKSEDFVIEMLPIVDNFECAMQTEIKEENKAYYDGVEIVYKQLIPVFESQGTAPIQTIGEEFDPNMHHAVMQSEDEDQPSNTVEE